MNSIKVLFSDGRPKLIVLAIFILSLACAVYIDQINHLALTAANTYSNDIRNILIAIFVSIHLSSYYADKQMSNDPKIVTTIQDTATSLAPFLAAYQLAIWLLIDINSAERVYLPYVDRIDVTMLVLAIILLIKLSFDNIMAHVINTVSLLFRSETVKVTVSESQQEKENVVRIKE